MSKAIEDLRKRMEAAAAAEDFEEARRLRDLLSLSQARPEADVPDDVDLSRLRRQTPGAMGLGSSDPQPKPPPGWTPPAKPDPMTAGQRPARRRRR